MHTNYQQELRVSEEYNFWIEKHSRRNQKGLDEAEDQINTVEDKVDKNSQKEQGKEKRLKKNKEVLREAQDTMKHNNIIIIGIPEGEEEQGIDTCLKK